MPKGNPGQTKEFLPNYSYQVKTQIFAAAQSKGAATPHIATLDSATGLLLQC